MVNAFCVFLQNLCLSEGHKDIFMCSFLISLLFYIWPTICHNFMLCMVEGRRSRFILFPKGNTSDQHHLLKRPPFFCCIVLTSQLPITMYVLFFMLFRFSFFVQYQYNTNCYSFVIVFDTYQYVFLLYLKKLACVLSLSLSVCCLIVITFNPQINLRIAISSILIHEHSIPSHLFRSSSISVNNVSQFLDFSCNQIIDNLVFILCFDKWVQKLVNIRITYRVFK